MPAGRGGSTCGKNVATGLPEGGPAARQTRPKKRHSAPAGRRGGGGAGVQLPPSGKISSAWPAVEVRGSGGPATRSAVSSPAPEREGRNQLDKPGEQHVEPRVPEQDLLEDHPRRLRPRAQVRMSPIRARRSLPGRRAGPARAPGRRRPVQRGGGSDRSRRGTPAVSRAAASSRRRAHRSNRTWSATQRRSASASRRPIGVAQSTARRRPEPAGQGPP